MASKKLTKLHTSLTHSLAKTRNMNYKILKRPYFKIPLKYKPSKNRLITIHSIRTLTQPKYIVHIGNLLAVCAMLQTEMVYLRSLMIGASTCGIVFNLLQPIPLVAPAIWGTFFIFSHSVQIYYLLRDKLSVTMPTELNQIYETVFANAGFTPKQFLDLCNSTSYKFINYKKGQNIPTNESNMTYSCYIMKGKAMVKVKTLGNIAIIDTENNKDATRWIGEFGQTEHEHKWQATYQCLSDCKILRFDKKKLELFLHENDSLKEKADRIMVNDIWKKFKNMRESNMMNSCVGMLNVYVNLLMKNKDSKESQEVKKYIQRFVMENNIDREYIELCLHQNHGLKYEQVFA